MEEESISRIYKIAYITADWNRELVAVALESLMDYLDAHQNIRAQVFNCFGFALHSSVSSFRYKVYDLADFGNYDAAIIQAHQIVDSFALKDLENRIVEAGIPAVSIGAEMKGCVCIGTDDYTASRCIAEHLICAHGAKTFLYLKGAERGEYGEAYERRKAFEDACAEHGIPKDSIRYFDGIWESERGAEAVRALLSSGEKLPDAIVSANDEMALGAISALSDAGIRIPEDILVSGFDDIFSASLSEPRLSTVKRGFYEIVQTGMNTLMDSLQGKSVPDHIYVKHEPVFSESCGCPGHTQSELRHLKTMYYRHQRLLGNYYALQDKLTAGLFSAENPIDILNVMERCYPIFGSPHMYIYINDFYMDGLASEEAAAKIGKGDFSDHLVLTGCGGIELPSDERHHYMTISRENLTELPLLNHEKFSIFYPLHYEGTMIGFMVLTKPPTVTEMNLHENIVNLFVFAMENTRQKLLALKLNDQLAALSVTDPLTGLYNRFGYDKYANELFGGVQKEGGKLRILFLDIDDMKYINDQFGHEFGDLAIRTLSEVIKASCRKSDFKMRFGGDEFVIITEAVEADIKSRLEHNLSAVNTEGKLPFPMRVSIGDYISEDTSGTTLDDLLTKADELMYKEKMLRKAGRR